MNRPIELNNSDSIKISLLGIYQTCGGIYGLIISGILIASFTSYSSHKIIMSILGIVLFLYSIFCGYLLLTHKYLKGLNLSIINNALQIIGFGLAGYSFKFVSGIFAGLTIEMTGDTLIGFGIDFSIITLGFDTNSQQIFVTLNILAIIILGFIFKIRDKIELKIKSQNEITDLDSTMHNNV